MQEKYSRPLCVWTDHVIGSFPLYMQIHTYITGTNGDNVFLHKEINQSMHNICRIYEKSQIIRNWSWVVFNKVGNVSQDATTHKTERFFKGRLGTFPTYDREAANIGLLSIKRLLS